MKEGDLYMNVIETLKSAKLRLYEKYILDSEGKLRLYSPIVQEVLLKVLEANGLEDVIKAYDKKMKEEAEKDC